MSYNVGQLQTLLRAAGCPEDKIPTLSAIGMGESSGNPDAVNDGSGTKSIEYSVGLWQINTRVHKNYSVAQLKNPSTNAAEAVRILKVQGLTAWGAFTDGRYRKYVNASVEAYAANGHSLPDDDDNTATLSVGAAAVVIGIIYFLF